MRNAPGHHTTFDNSRADWDGFRDYIRDVSREDILIFSLCVSGAVF